MFKVENMRGGRINFTGSLFAAADILHFQYIVYSIIVYYIAVENFFVIDFYS